VRAAQRGIVTNGVQYAKSVEARHHDVGQNQIGMQATRGFDGRQPIGYGMNAIPIAQEVNILAHVGIVVGEQDKFALSGCLKAGCGHRGQHGNHRLFRGCADAWGNQL